MFLVVCVSYVIILSVAGYQMLVINRFFMWYSETIKQLQVKPSKEKVEWSTRSQTGVSEPVSSREFPLTCIEFEVNEMIKSFEWFSSVWYLG